MDKIKQLKLKHIPVLLIALILIFALIVWVINLSVFDEEASEGVLEIIAPHPMPAAENNAYFMFHGFQARNEDEPIEAGQRLIERYSHNRDILKKDELKESDINEVLGNTRVDKDWYDAFKLCRSRTDFNCLQKNIDQVKDLSNKSERLELMLKRYERLVSMTDYKQVNGLTFYSPLPGYSYPMTLHQIRIAESYHSGDIELFISRIKSDLRFWRMLLTKGDALIEKMIAVAAIWNNMSYLSYAIREAELTSNQIAIIENLLAPLTKEELDISESFKYEAQYMYRQLGQISKEEYEAYFGNSHWIFSNLIQPNATNNLHYDKFLMPLVQHAKQDSKAFASSYLEIRKELEKNSSIGWSPSNLYNLGGKMLVSYSMYMANDYSARTHDLNGIIKLVNLQLSLKSKPKDSWTSLIRKSKFRNPYNDQAFSFDSEKKELGFKCLDKNSKCIIPL